MRHQHLFSTSQMFESEDQNWNHMNVEQPYTNLARGGPAENGSFLYPVDNMSVDRAHFNPHWNPTPVSNGYISSHHGIELSHYQPSPSEQTHDPLLHLSTAGNFCTVPGNYAHHASSSNNDIRAFHGIDGGFVDLTMGNGRGHHKRKSPAVPSACERGSTSGCHGGGSSSDFPVSGELQAEKPNLVPQYFSWECSTITPSYRGNLSLNAENSARNVRSRPGIDLENNPTGTHLSNITSHSSCSVSHPMDHTRLMDFSGQDTSGFSHEANHFLAGTGMNRASADARGYHHDFILNGNPIVPQSFHGTSSHSVRGVRSNYSQRPSPAFRAPTSSLHLGHHVPTSEEGLQLVSESYSSRQPRTLSTPPWRNGDRNRRSRVSYDRYQSLTNGTGLHDRFSSEGLMVLDRSAFYRSRNTLDQHRDMRLDIDNMTYEELLALGERIGNVNTGLSEDLISKCLTGTIYCSSDQFQEGLCVICLEEYEDADDVGTLKTCGHDYHVSCIKKWLSMKNSCPICKTCAVADDDMKIELS